MRRTHPSRRRQGFSSTFARSNILENLRHHESQQSFEHEVARATSSSDYCACCLVLRQNVHSKSSWILSRPFKGIRHKHEFSWDPRGTFPNACPSCRQPARQSAAEAPIWHANYTAGRCGRYNVCLKRCSSCTRLKMPGTTLYQISLDLSKDTLCTDWPISKRRIWCWTSCKREFVAPT